MALNWNALTDQIFSSTMSPETVAYARGSDSVSVSALRNTETAQYQNADVVEVLDAELSFSIKAADLLIDSTAIKPIKGDTITDANSAVYVVQYFDVDGMSLIYRVYVKRVDS